MQIETEKNSIYQPRLSDSSVPHASIVVQKAKKETHQ